MARHRDINPAALAERLDSLPGVELLREIAAQAPAYLVGGAVRDLLLGASRADLDVVVEGGVERLAAELGGEVVSHERFSTATVTSNGLVVDIAQARTETYARPGALPDVSPATLAEDLGRRDFTINAMALPLAEPRELIDPHGGLQDLRDGLLRVLHPGSFRDDPTRALRAARYTARLELELADETSRQLGEIDLGTVSSDRVTAELEKLAREPSATKGFELVDLWKLVELNDGAVRLIEAITRLLAAPPWKGFAEREAPILLAAVGNLAAARELAVEKPARPSTAVALARGHRPVELVAARALGAEWLDRYVAEWRNVEIEIDGADLIAAGIEEGPAVGRGLSVALDAKLDGEVGGREAELERALEAARRS